MSRVYSKIFILGIIVAMVSCTHKAIPSSQQRRCYYDSLCSVVYSSKSIQVYDEAVYFYWTNQDVVSNEEAAKLAKFMADSAHCVSAWNFYAINSIFEETDSIKVLYNLLKEYALGLDYSIADFKKRLPLKPELTTYLDNNLPLQMIIHPDSISNHRLMYYFSTAYGRYIIYRKDTSDYQVFRHLVHENDLFPIAKSIADNTAYVPAYLDVYRCYTHIDGYPVMMSSENFAEANIYLEYAVEHDYLPAIWIKSLLCLTGTYLPQDTIEGKRLLDLCVEPSLYIDPFWRYADNIDE